MLVLLFLFLFFQTIVGQNCYRFCKVSILKGYFNVINYKNIDILRPENCSHLVIDSYAYNTGLDLVSLEKAYANLQSSNTTSMVKILVYISKPFNYTFSNDLENQVFQKFDGFYISWDDSRFSSVMNKFHDKPLNIKQGILNNYLTNLRKTFKNKLIVVTVGADTTQWEYFVFAFFKNTVDFIALQSRQRFSDLYMQNVFGARVLQGGGKDHLTTFEETAKKWTDNGFPRNRILIFIDYLGGVSEPRKKTIWSSLNNLAGIFINDAQVIREPSKGLNEMINEIKKFERVQICTSDSEKAINLQLLCYFSLNDEFEPNENLYQNCDKIIFKGARLDHQTLNIVFPGKYFNNTVENLLNQNLSNSTQIFSIPLNYDVLFAGVIETNKKDILNTIASNLIIISEEYRFAGIELVCDESADVKMIQEIISVINSKSENIQIGLQVNVLKISSLFVPIINNSTWVTHSINSLNDPALAIFYKWNKLHENYGLNLHKVIIKFSPGIWQQDAAYPYPSLLDKKSIYLENENPENDVILNRKYLCFNETLKNSAPSTEFFSFLPMIFTIHEDFEKRKKRILKDKFTSDPIFGIQLFMMGTQLSTDLFYIRFESKETMKYKIKIAAKHGFGGISMDSMNDDDNNEICGKSLFIELIEILKR